MKVIDCVDIENNGSLIGEFVRCIVCKRVILSDRGVEHCPLCGEFDSTEYVDETHKEITVKELEQLGYDVEPKQLV